MPDSLSGLEKRRSEVLAEISTLAISGLARSRQLAVAAAPRTATAISRTIPAMAQTSGSPTRSMARPLRRAFPILRRSVKPNARSPVSGRISN